MVEQSLSDHVCIVKSPSEGFQSLDIKFAVALKKIFPTTLRKRVSLIEEKWIDRHETQIKGRQLLVILLK